MGKHVKAKSRRNLAEDRDRAIGASPAAGNQGWPTRSSGYTDRPRFQPIQPVPGVEVEAAATSAITIAAEVHHNVDDAGQAEVALHTVPDMIADVGGSLLDGLPVVDTHTVDAPSTDLLPALTPAVAAGSLFDDLLTVEDSVLPDADEVVELSGTDAPPTDTDADGLAGAASETDIPQPVDAAASDLASIGSGSIWDSPVADDAAFEYVPPAADLGLTKAAEPAPSVVVVERIIERDAAATRHTDLPAVPDAASPSPAPAASPAPEMPEREPATPVSGLVIPPLTPEESAPAYLGESIYEAPIPDVHTPKAPLFTWRGKPLGGGSIPESRPAPSKRKAKAAVAVDPDAVDPQQWFEDTMQHALDLGASDMHLNLDKDGGTLVVRLRIDGQMRPFKTIHGVNAHIIMGRFKAAADLTTGVSFVPQESLYEVDVDGEMRKARIALFHTSNGGDALVLRLPTTGPLRHLDELEIAPDNLALFRKMLGAANKMICIAGPMGSGKTTTAHAALLEVAQPSRTVWTVEDPVERDLPGLTQLEIDEANGAGFEALLPKLLRSDYDTLFLGEIRDKATAEAGVRQAKVGRQIITTIHANNNVTALLRLIELAEDTPLSVMDAVLGIVSQRLVRRLNPIWDHIDPVEKYKGRVPIHEVLLVNDEITEALMTGANLSTVKELAAKASAVTFGQDAKRLIEAGITDEEEVRRVLGE